MNQKWHKHVIAVTGVIGSGKSSVVDNFRTYGAFCVSADDLARQIVEPGSEGLKQIVSTFSDDILLPDGKLDRNKLRKVVFDNPEKKQTLEDITHPLIRKLADETFSAALKDKHPLYVYDVPLLFETELHKEEFKKIVLVSASKETCLKRVMERSQLTRQQAEEIFDSQISLEEKAKLSDIVIDNSGSQAELESKSKEVFESLKA